MSQQHVTVDGPAASGKSTAGLALSRALGVGFLDAGRIYRLFGALSIERGIDPADARAFAGVLSREGCEVLGGQAFCVGGSFYDDHLERADAERRAAEAASAPETRLLATELARSLVARIGPSVIVGRDAGTDIAPDAAVKFYLSADHAERLRRRSAQDGDRADILAYKDGVDERRFASGEPRHAPDAIVLDVTASAPDQVLSDMLRLSLERGFEPERRREGRLFVEIGDAAEMWSRGRERLLERGLDP